MNRHPRELGLRAGRRGRELRPGIVPLEQRVVPSLTFPGLTGITFDTSGDVFLSYNSSSYSVGQQQSVAEVGANGYLASASVFSTSGSSATPGALTSVSSSASLPSVSSSDLLELEPDGQLFVFDPANGASSQYDNLGSYTPAASKVFDVQTNASVNLSSQINLATATFGDLGIYQNSLVVAAESNNWDFVMRLTYGSSGGVATILVASPASDGLTASPEGVAVDSQGTVLTTLPYLPQGSSTAIHVAVGFNLFYDTGATPAPTVPTLGLTSVPSIDSAGITVDSENNFLLAATDSSLYGGGPGIVHINSALTAFLADPTESAAEAPTGIAYQNVGGTNYLSFTDAASDTYTLAGELSLFSGQATPAQVREAYAINQISFSGPSGATVTGDGTGQTIAIVEEGVDTTLDADLNTFDQYFGIPAPPSFQMVDQNGVTTQNLSIVGEASLDVEWAHAVAPGASIIVYNAAYEPNNSAASLQNLLEAMQQASKLPGVSVVTLSYGVPEAGLSEAGLNEKTIDSYFTTPGVTFLAAAGDTGIYASDSNEIAANYPAASPNVVAVGGTSIVIDSAGDYPGTGTSGEVAWGDGSQSGTSGGGGGGLSAVESEPSWQSDVVSSTIDSSDARALPDVSMDSGAAQEYDVFTSTLSGSSVSSSAVGWLGDAGTSAASPIWAGLIAIADQGRALAGGTALTGFNQTLPALYALPSSDFHDILYGNNGDPAGTGYDLATGRGTPVANLLVPALADYQIASQMAITTEPPSSVTVATSFGLAVRVEDNLGNLVNSGTVTVSLGNNPGGATLGGTLTASVVNGVATFSGLTLNKPGSGYTLTLTESTIPGTETTTAISATAGIFTTKVSATATPAAPVFGQSIALDANVSVISPGTGVPTGVLTFDDGSTVLGNAVLSNGVAELTATALAAGTQTITISYGGDANDQPSSATLTLSVAKAAATLDLRNAVDTYDGLPQAVTVTTSPLGLSGVTLSYSQNGVAVTTPTSAGTYSVTATLNNTNYSATAATGVLVINAVTPTIAWATPADIVAGTPLGDGQLDAVATIGGTPVSGTYTYTPAAGAVLPTGNGQILTVTFTPTDSTDFKTVTAAVPINISPSSTSTPTSTTTPHAVITGEQPVFTRKLNKHGKPVGKPVLTGFTLDFNMPLSPAAASDSGSYELDTVTTKKVRKVVERISHPITKFSVSYAPSTDSVTLELTGKQTFPTGGQITVFPTVAAGSDGVLSGPEVFTITAGGKRIVPS